MIIENKVGAKEVERAVTVSIVSHGQGALVAELLRDLGTYSAARIEVILTINIDEDLPFREDSFGFPLRILWNGTPQGFGTNHNAAFARRHCRCFCVLNPDIRLTSDPFAPLLEILSKPDVGVVAPLVRSIDGDIEDSARRMPTPLIIVSKVFRRRSSPDYRIADGRIQPDWVAGMFMLFGSDVFARMAGFDERYFLYYEDVDLCARLVLSGYTIVLDPVVSVIHDARRESHRRFRYFRRHVASISRFFLSSVYFRYMLRRMRRRNSAAT